MSMIAVKRFEEGQSLTGHDRDLLRSSIDSDTDLNRRVLFLETYCEAFPCDEWLVNRSKSILNSDCEPIIAVTCLRALAEHCSEDFFEVIDFARRFVDFEKYEEWTDEVIFCSNYFHRHYRQLNEFDKRRLKGLISAASASGAYSLVDLLTK